MKTKPRIIFALLALTSVVLPAQTVTIPWMGWEEAVKASETDKNPKKIFVDVYTDWCGWCKKMDKDTFNSPEVAAYMVKNFYMVKLDAEGKENITYKGKTYKYIASGRRGYHEFAAGLLQGRLSYPTVAFLDENQKLISLVPGYADANRFLKIARYFGEDIFKQKKWDEYEREQSKK